MYNGGGMYGGMGMNPAMGGYGGAYGSGGMGGYGGGMAGYGGRGGMGGRGMGRGGAAPGGYEGDTYGGGGYQGGRGGGRGQRADQDFVEGKLFVGGLDTQTTKETLVEYCQQWGELADHVLMEGRGFGFITFRDPAGAQTFLEHREHIIDGKRVEAKAAVPRNSSSGSSLTKKMFVGGTGEVNDDDFRNYFEQFGEIEDCVVLRKPDGGSRGFGFVTYKDEISVEKCLVMQHQLNGRTVELKRAIKKEDMSAGGGGAGGYGGGGYGAGGYGSGGGYTSGGGGYTASGAGGYPTGGAGGPVRTGKAPDWVCPNADCRNKNFGWREQCNRCQAEKPANPELAPARPGTGGGYAARQSSGYEAMNGMSAMSMGMGGMGGMGMPAMGGMGYGMGSMGYGMGGMGGMAMGGMGAMGGYGSQGGYVGNGGGQGYGRASGGRGGSQQGRYRPY